MQFSATSGRLAQTNLQLLNQLREEGYPLDALLLICDAYALAVRLYTGYFKASGRTQIAHIVGTASILAALKAPAAVLAAALIHSAYENGDFGISRYGITAAKRKQLICAVGEDVERVVEKYYVLQKSNQPLAALIGQMDTNDQIRRDALLIDLVEHFEQYLNDAGLPGSRKYVERNGYTMIDAAQRLGFPGLAEGIQKAIERANAHECVFGELVKRSTGGRSRWIVPASYRKCLSVRFHEAVVPRLRRFASQRIVHRVRPLLKVWEQRIFKAG